MLHIICYIVWYTFDETSQENIILQYITSIGCFCLRIRYPFFWFRSCFFFFLSEQFFCLFLNSTPFCFRLFKSATITRRIINVLLNTYLQYTTEFKMKKKETFAFLFYLFWWLDDSNSNRVLRKKEEISHFLMVSKMFACKISKYTFMYYIMVCAHLLFFFS